MKDWIYLRNSLKNKNDRSRSAKLRVATRNQNKFFFPNDLKIKFKNFLEIEESYG